MGVIYIAINKNNDKSYIGQTVKPLEVRKKQHKYRAYYIKDGVFVSDTLFCRAIRKYGFDAFDWKILYTVDDKKLDKMEVRAIRESKTYVKNGGYNSTFGGDDNPSKHPDSAKKISEKNKGKNSAWYGKKHSEETKKKMSIAQTGKKLSEKAKKKISIAQTGRTHCVSDETRKKMSEAQSGEKHPMWGKKHTEETRIKMSKTRKGKRRKLTQKQVKSIHEKYSTGKYSYDKLSDIYNVSKSTIHRIIKS